MLHVDAHKKLTIFLPSSNKALQKALTEIAKEDSTYSLKPKNLKEMLSDILKNSAQDSLQNKTLLELLKNNATFKELANIQPTITALIDELASLKNNSKFTKLFEALHALQEDMKNINPKELLQKLQNSGVFLESKLKHLNTKEFHSLQDDLKALLLSAKEELKNTTLPNKEQLQNQIQKTLLQIDYYQLYSHLSNGSAVFVPYSFDAMEQGEIVLKKGKNEAFFCDINLKLKEYGELFVRLGLFEEKELNINLQTDSPKLHTLLESKLEILQEALTRTGLHVKSIRFLSQTNCYENEAPNYSAGFETKA